MIRKRFMLLSNCTCSDAAKAHMRTHGDGLHAHVYGVACDNPAVDPADAVAKIVASYCEPSNLKPDLEYYRRQLSAIKRETDRGSLP